MQMIVYVLVAVAFFSILDLVPAIRENNRKFVYIYSVMMTAVLVVWILLAKGVELPSPNPAIRAAIEAIVGPQK